MTVDCNHASPAVQTRQETGQSQFHCSLEGLPSANQRGYRMRCTYSHQPLAPPRATHSHSFIVSVETASNDGYVAYSSFFFPRCPSSADGGKSYIAGGE
jgi:hypothetical protein